MRPNASPSTASEALRASAAAFSTSSAAGFCSAETAAAPGLMMPDLTVAISAIVFPRRSAWSRSIGANTTTSPSAVLVESHEPPIPTSITATSTGASAKATKASTVSSSKKVRGASPAAASSASTRSTNGEISSQASATSPSSIGSPSIMTRSVNRSRCGLVNRPVRRPWARTIDSTIRAVDVLPLVPVRCTTR